MIRTKREYEASLKKLKQSESTLETQRKELEKMNFSQEQLKAAIAPLKNFHNQLKEEVKLYEDIKSQNWEVISLLYIQHTGNFLIALRLAFNLSQRELADLLNVTEAQVSKDERNEYHGVSQDKVNKILSIFNVELLPPKINTHINRDSLLNSREM